MGVETRGDCGPYYYRKVREGQRVRSVYVGSGEFALALAALDREKREEKKAERLQTAPTPDPRAVEIVSRVEAHFEGVGALVRTHLEAQGYRRHKRGEWRRARR